MFKIQEDSFGNLTQLEINNVLSGEYVTIIHDYGTNINELVLHANRKNIPLLRGTNDSKDMTKKQWFKGAKLAPFPNRIKDGKYSFNGKEYTLPKNESNKKNSLHGFMFNKAFDLISHSESSTEGNVEFEYTHNGKLDGFPFPFRMNIVYALSEDGFECVTTVRNIGTEPMPFGDGWHPYFKTGTLVDRLQLILPECEEMEVDENLIPTGKTKPYSRFNELETIGKTNFDTPFVIKTNPKEDTAYVQLYDPDRDFQITLWQETGNNKYNYFQLYIPEDRQSIAIEPMTCAPDAFNNGIGLITLQPGESFTGTYGVTLK